MNRPLSLLALCMMVLSLSGCPEFWQKALPVITDIIVKVLDAEQQLDAIEKGVEAYYKAQPDADAEARAKAALAKARASLNIALRAAHGMRSTGEGDADQAFEDFKVTYQELVALLGELGIVKEDSSLVAGPHKGVKLLPLLALESKEVAQ